MPGWQLGTEASWLREGEREAGEACPTSRRLAELPGTELNCEPRAFAPRCRMVKGLPLTAGLGEVGAMAAFGVNITASPREKEQKMKRDSTGRHPWLTLRPHQALCAVCSLGEQGSVAKDEGLTEMLEVVRQSPDMPVTLRCNAGDVFVFQEPGVEHDTPGGAEYNRRRDLEILLRLDFVPGTTITARILFHRLIDRITTVSGICGFGTPTSDAWKGCPKANSGHYERARQRGIAAIIPPRGEDEMARDKRESLEAMYKAKATGIKVRPHILVCAVCQYGGGTRPPFKPDNLPELMALIREEPDTLITMVEGADWMMCAPCPNRAPELNACVNVKGSGGLTNQLRDLRTLQALGLAYGTTMKAGELYRLIFERIPTTLDVCRFDSAAPSVWWDGCGARTTNNPNYARGREILMAELAPSDEPTS